MSSRFQPNVTPDVETRLRRIKVLLMDVDGVLTDGRLFYLPKADGSMVEFKGFHSHDGLGFHLLNAVGIKHGVISGRESPAVVERARILKMSFVYQGLLDKIGAYEEVLQRAGVTRDEVAFVGDDFPDAPLMRMSGLACCVGDARAELKSIAHIVTTCPGGHGAVREIIELILKAQGKWEDALKKYHLLSAPEPVSI